VASVDPRRARWALRITGAVFAVGTVVAAVTAANTLPPLRVTAHRVLSKEMAEARGERQAEFVRRFEGTRDALASAGWALGPADAAPRFECWVEEDESVCGLFAHTEVSTNVPAAPAAQVTAVDQMFATTSSTLADDGWQCSGALARTPGRQAAVSCASGDTRLEVVGHDPVTAAGDYPQLTVELHISREAYRSGADGTSV
jgi:hypothetical protein